MTSRMTGRILAAALLLLPLTAGAEPPNNDSHNEFRFPYSEATVAQLQAEMAKLFSEGDQLSASSEKLFH